MKSNTKLKITILITLGILFALAPMIIRNPGFIIDDNDATNFDKENLKISATSAKIHINNNWTDARNAGICTGNGTYSEPYVIEDLVIDAEESGSCIFIENSAVYFTIENCTLYGTDSGPEWGAGILLSNVNNSLLIGNDCSYNLCAIQLNGNNYNNTIIGNIVNIGGGGIYILGSHYNTISGNTMNNNLWCGIYLRESHYNTISGNTACNNSICGIYSSGIFLGDSNYNMISGNTLNKNFRGIEIIGNYNNITGNTANNNDYCGIGLYYSIYNTITGNAVNNNEYGIILYVSKYNTISGNTLIGNDECIVENYCQENIFKDNECMISLNYFPIILIIFIPILGVSVFMIYKNGKMFKKPQEDLEFL